MEREFTYTKDKLRFILGEILQHDVLDAPAYRTDERAEEGFEKRAVLEFVLWFLEEAFPDDFSFGCKYEDLEGDYGEAVAKFIVEGRGWASRQVGATPVDGNVVFVDFKKKS